MRLLQPGGRIAKRASCLFCVLFQINITAAGTLLIKTRSRHPKAAYAHICPIEPLRPFIAGHGCCIFEKFCKSFLLNSPGCFTKACGKKAAAFGLRLVQRHLFFLKAYPCTGMPAYPPCIFKPRRLPHFAFIKAPCFWPHATQLFRIIFIVGRCCCLWDGQNYFISLSPLLQASAESGLIQGSSRLCLHFASSFYSSLCPCGI